MRILKQIWAAFIGWLDEDPVLEEPQAHQPSPLEDNLDSLEGWK